MMTYNEVKDKLQSYLDLLRLVQVKRDMWEAAKQDADTFSTIYGATPVKSSPHPEKLNAVERAADRLMRIEGEYMAHCERLWALEDELGRMIELLPEGEQALVIERYMKGENLRYIAKKYYYQRDSLYVVFGRIYKKIAVKAKC